MPDATVAAGRPLRASIAYCMPPAAATPPGTTRPNEFAASCEVTTGPQRSVRSASRCSAHMQA